jgi:hypothetical protein
VFFFFVDDTWHRETAGTTDFITTAEKNIRKNVSGGKKNCSNCSPAARAAAADTAANPIPYQKPLQPACSQSTAATPRRHSAAVRRPGHGCRPGKK